MTRARDVSRFITTPPSVYYTDEEALNNLMRYRFVATGGETSISGADANGFTLSYVAGIEKVYLNGALLVKGYDYIATNGTSITSLSPALVNNDVIEIFSFNTFNVANTYTQAQVDGLITTANNAIGMKLIVPTSATNGTVGASGAVTFTGVSSVSLNGVFSSTYDNYRIHFANVTNSSSGNINLRWRVSGTDDSAANYRYAGTQMGTNASPTNVGAGGQTSARIGYFTSGQRNFLTGVDVSTPFLSCLTGTFNSAIDGSGATSYVTTTTSFFNADTSFTGFTIFPAAGTITGTIQIYGLTQ